jgi:hypothetical protein
VILVNEGSVTTLSGRQAQLQWVDLHTVLTATNASATGVPGGASALVTNQVPIDSAVDILPFVGADGFTIRPTAFISTTEFLGYVDPSQFIPQADSDGSDKPHKAVLPVPHFRVRQIPTHSAVVRDGQTLVLGLFDQIDTNQIPVFSGDRPQLGRLFRSEPQDKDFIVFLTPTIIDPAGNRIHAADESPEPVPKTK